MTQPLPLRETTAGTVLAVEPAACLFCGASAPDRLLASGRDYEYDTSEHSFDLRLCEQCGLAFLRPRPAPAAMSVIYPEHYYAYHEHELERPVVKLFRDRVERTKVDRYRRFVSAPEAEVVDIGCGDGRLLELVQRFGPPDWKQAGIELAAGAAEFARRKGFEVKTGDFEELDVGDWQARFDLALMHHVIEHTRDPRAAIRKAASMLRPGGVLSVETPELCGWDFELFRRHYWGGYHFPRHFFLFTRETLSRLLREEGFEIASVRSMPSPAFWIHSIHNWLVDRSWGKSLARFFHPQNLLAVCVATAVDLVQLTVRKQSTNLQILARKA